MPALAKIATATALALSLAGGATALAQSTTAVENHSAYVEMVILEEPDGETRTILQGAVPCKAELHQRLWRSYLGRPDCKFAGYAYAFPEDQPAPWKGEVETVNDTTYVNDRGDMFHQAEIVYRTVGTASDDGPQLVRAFATELRPIDRSDDQGGARYELPVDEDLTGTNASDLTVEVGPEPSEVRATAS